MLQRQNSAENCRLICTYIRFVLCAQTEESLTKFYAERDLSQQQYQQFIDQLQQQSRQLQSQVPEHCCDLFHSLIRVSIL